jgi:UDP-N-acetylmuramate dehydrogenase
LNMLHSQTTLSHPGCAVPFDSEVLQSLWSFLKAESSGECRMEVLWDIPLASCTTFRIGGPARCLVRPATVEGVAEIFNRVRAAGVPHLVLGGGSNVLASDEPMEGVVVQLSRACSEIRIAQGGERGAVRVHVGAGLRLSRLIRFCLENGLSGVEPLVGIPGTVGGAVVMNAGTREGCVADVLLSIEVMDERGVLQRLERRDLSPEYRSMRLPGDWTVIGACLGLVAASRAGIRSRLQSAVEQRKATQPLNKPSAGSIYKNPVDAPAGWLIERAGLKGFRVGGAAVSEKHANWIVNLGGATSADVRAVMDHIEKSVRLAFGVCLEREILIL